MTKKFPKTIRTKQPILNPISGNKVYEVITAKTLEPNVGVLKFRIKNIVKKISKRGLLTPSLYFDKEMNFAFFPRQDDEWLNEFYTSYGEAIEEDTSERLSFFNSPALAQSAEIMLDFAELKNGTNACVDYGSGTGWLAKAMIKRTNNSVKAVDFSFDVMSHLRELTDGAIEPIEMNDFLAPEQPQFDFLASMDTIEHLNDPLSTLEQIYKKAKNGASVFLSVPNFDSYFSQIHFGCHPYYSYFPTHLNFFTTKALKELSELAGFKVIKQAVVTLPWEMEYISRFFPRQMSPINSSQENGFLVETAWSLWDKLNNGTDGERLFILLEK